MSDHSGGARRRRWWPYALAVVVIVAGAFGAAAIVLTSAKASLSATGDGLAHVTMPLGGGTIESVTVTTLGRRGHAVPVTVQGDPEIVPSGKLDANRRVEITVKIKRPGWVSWLTGSTETLHMTTTTPVASLHSHFLTVKGGTSAPLTLSFKSPVTAIAYGTAGHMTHKVLPTPQAQVQIPRPAVAGTELVSATIRPWERAKSASISWFPAGGTASAISSPAPGQTISADTPITMTFSKPVSKVLDGHMPVVTPAGSGAWKTISTHAIEFVPSGYGYGLGANVSIAMPASVRLSGAAKPGVGTWTVPVGSTLRLQQLLAELGYLPFKMSYATGKSPATTPLAQEEAATTPPKATFDWAYGSVPSALRQMWAPGTAGTMTKGAVMAFENAHGMTADGVAGPAVWRDLINDIDAAKVSTFGYTFVQVSEGSPETESTWHSGKTVVSGLVNTGVPAAPTAQGVFPVFEHAPSVTMSGTNPDGSHYSDPGVLWVSYFNGGDALHEFPRGGYGYPQSDGCVEMPLSEAASVYPYTPIGTLVDVT